MIHYISLYNRKSGITYFAQELSKCIHCDTIMVGGFFTALNSLAQNIFSGDQKIEMVKLSEYKIETIPMYDELKLDIVLIHDDYQPNFEKIVKILKKNILKAFSKFKKKLNHNMSKVSIFILTVKKQH